MSRLKTLQIFILAPKRPLFVTGRAITQHQHGTQNSQQLINLLLLKGNIGKAGSGIFSLRGHSNVQGDRTVGITEKPSELFLNNIERYFGFIPPKNAGDVAIESMKSISRGSARVLVFLGNFAVAMPDSPITFERMKQLDLVVHLATKLSRSHLLTAKQSYILPVLGRTENDMQ